MKEYGTMGMSLYRGLSHKNPNIWVYGYPIPSIRYGVLLYDPTIDKNHRIIPETLGKQIKIHGFVAFEGDILAVTHQVRDGYLCARLDKLQEYNPRRSYDKHIEEDNSSCFTVFKSYIMTYKRNYVIEWHKEMCKYYLRNGSDKHDFTFKNVQNCGKILGNVHQHPQLLIPKV